MPCERRTPWVWIWSRLLRPLTRLFAKSLISANTATSWPSRRKTASTAPRKLKEVKFRVNIDEHDYTTKVRRAEEFLDKSNKVKIQLQFRGREMAHKELGDQLMQRVKRDLDGMSQVEMEPKHAGRSINMTLSPLPAVRRKRKFAPLDEAETAAAEEAEASDDEQAKMLTTSMTRAYGQSRRLISRLR